ncbi:glycosyltransferase family 9 protein [Conexibacter sp. SYSU D00693]|uniref:glycosyltransferase family 9 protein n=1 Tax=Conexibacter sp. SYSU D00693 TaxID=2812560 RepID=UPI00196A234D|nr:glycosyltransferase family 9 protein [Conexibacter sp. SYSU D00693]
MAAVGRPRVLVLRALGLGDLLAAVPALRGIARAFPDHRRQLACPAPLAPLAHLTGAVDEVVDVRWVHAVGDVLPEAVHGADVAVNLHGAGPQSTAALAATRPRRLIAFGVGGARPYPTALHERERWCALLADHAIAADPDDLLLRAPPAMPPRVAPGATVVHPGAASPARRWPATRWAAVARAEEDAGRPAVLTGSAAERPLAEEVAQLAGLPPGRVLAGRTDVLGLGGVVAAAGRVVSGDTGVAHLAYALGRPTVTLFGPTPPEQWGPPGLERHVVLRGGEGAGDPHAAEPDPRLLAIDAADVVAALAGLSCARTGAGDAAVAVRQ